VTLNAAEGEREGAWIVVTGASQVAASVDVAALGGLGAEIAWAHYVHFDAGDVPDALLPWGGEARPAERTNQPLYLRVIVPDGAGPAYTTRRSP
jgi:hypothetical protein